MQSLALLWLPVVWAAAPTGFYCDDPSSQDYVSSAPATNLNYCTSERRWSGAHPLSMSVSPRP
jgi:hypothetical protein